MKKTLSAILAISAVSSALVGCGVPKPHASTNTITTRAKTEVTETDKNSGAIEVEPEKEVRLGQSRPIFGVRRRMRSLAGEYSAEYVHSDRDKQKDDTLSYSLTLRDDNTYDMTVVTDGVKAVHYGNWYLHSGGGLTLYYDEPLDSTAHNVYVSDCLYGEVLENGKIMVFENGNVIVLARNDDYRIMLPRLYLPIKTA
ncbi:MAG: hypothetical protein J1G38_05930 [Clostridiales bacterium]|nr:hypothetical protein [Clostridiales bacterium]